MNLQVMKKIFLFSLFEYQGVPKQTLLAHFAFSQLEQHSDTLTIVTFILLSLLFIATELVSSFLYRVYLTFPASCYHHHLQLEKFHQIIFNKVITKFISVVKLFLRWNRENSLSMFHSCSLV